MKPSPVSCDRPLGIALAHEEHCMVPSRCKWIVATNLNIHNARGNNR